jgi:hypothetical protein
MSTAPPGAMLQTKHFFQWVMGRISVDSSFYAPTRNMATPMSILIFDLHQLMKFSYSVSFYYRVGRGGWR